MQGGLRLQRSNNEWHGREETCKRVEYLGTQRRPSNTSPRSRIFSVQNDHRTPKIGKSQAYKLDEKQLQKVYFRMRRC